MKITIIAGARPNFIKIAPIIKAIEKRISNGEKITYRIAHTGQHYDDKMSTVFFESLKIPAPHINFNIGSSSHAQQTAKIMIAAEKEFTTNLPDIVIVVGDVNSTMACTIVAKKLHIKVAHVEAGLRSNDITMPEEINRLVTDSIADVFFTTTELASQTLEISQNNKNNIHFVGNTMIDTLVQQLPNLIKPKNWEETQLSKKEYILLTMHRPSNVDDFNTLKDNLEYLCQISQGIPIVFPIHPRTKKYLDINNYLPKKPIILCDAMPYLQFMYLLKHCKVVITDSGGIQEESTYLGVPCITMRENTERPETITIGKNELVGNDKTKLKKAIGKILKNEWKKGTVPPLWDGKAAERIIDILTQDKRTKC